MRTEDGWVLFKDLVVEAGYRGKGAVTLLAAVVSSITTFERRPRSTKAGGKPTYYLPEKDAPAVLSLLKERRALNPGKTQFLGKSLILPPPKVIGFKKGAESLEQELTGLTRRLKQVFHQLDVEEYTLVKDAKADGGWRCEVVRIKTTTEEIK